MNILISPDSFKESLSAMTVARCIESGFRTVFPDSVYQLLPVADGGEGTAKTLLDAKGGVERQVTVTGPLNKPVTASYALIDDGKTAVIEMATASGLELVPAFDRDPLHTTSLGTGELILDALEQGVENLIIGLGGSATNDGGAGMLQALGARLLDRIGNPVVIGAVGLDELERLELEGIDHRLKKVRIKVACDVTNPLCGPQGASAVFGPQKGASVEQIKQLDQWLAHWGRMLEQSSGRKVMEIPGSGAAGGLGAALLATAQAELRPGIELVAEAVGLKKALQSADLLITGEGRLDGQSAQGKAPAGVARMASDVGVPVIGIGGSLGPDHDQLLALGMDALFGAVQSPMSLEQALTDAEINLCAVSAQVARALALGRRLPNLSPV